VEVADRGMMAYGAMAADRFSRRLKKIVSMLWGWGKKMPTKPNQTKQTRLRLGRGSGPVYPRCRAAAQLALVSSPSPPNSSEHSAI